MADKQISQLTAATTVNDNDLLVLQQGDTAKKLTGKKLGDYVYAAAAEKIEEVNAAVAASTLAVAELEAQKDEIVAVIASMAQLGTDTTLTQTGMAADAKTVGDKLTLLASNIAGVEATRTATKNYPVDSLVIFNYNLYKVTSPIATGELITPNANCVTTTLAAELEAIQASLGEALSEQSDRIEELDYDVTVLKSFHKSELTWAQIQDIVQDGHAQDWFNIGDQLTVNWTKGGTTHQLPFDVVSFDPVLKYGENAQSPGMWIQSHYAGDGVQFDASEAIYVASSALPAGTYHFSFGTTWGTNVVSGKSYQFTTTQEIPVGGQIMIGKNNDWYTWGAPDVAPSSWSVHTFTSNAAVTPLESNLALTEGTGGTDLGSLVSTTKYSSSGLNNLQRAGYGYNRWGQSANRKYYNSSAAAGEWWTPSNPFDRAPQQLSSVAGYMAGFEEDFLAVLGNVKVTTALNTVSDTDIGASEDTYDTFFLASLEQEYCAPQASGVEGAYWLYWKERLGLNSPQQSGSANANENHIRYAYDARTTAQACGLRSANRSSAFYTWYVTTTGYVYSYYATYAFRGCPACVIC